MRTPCQNMSSLKFSTLSRPPSLQAPSPWTRNFQKALNMEVKVVAPCTGEITRLLRLLPGSKASKPVKKGEALLSVGGKTVSRAAVLAAAL